MGFEKLTREQVLKYASMGGKEAHRTGKAHQWTVAEAKDAGRKGGLASQALRREAASGIQGTGEGRQPAAEGSSEA